MSNITMSVLIARRKELHRRLLILSKWCEERVAGVYNTETTLSMLRNKINEIDDGVDRAGWRAAKKQNPLA